MKLEIARGIFLVAALGVSALAAASWYEPDHGVVSSHGRSYCLNPELKRSISAQAPDSENVFLLVMSLSQGMR